MNLMLYKDGRLVISEQGKPLEGDEQNIDGLYAYITDPKDGDSIVYDAASGTWKTGAGGGGSFSPDITDPQDGQTLVYDATAGKWVNGAGGGGTMRVNITATWIELDEDYEFSADKTYAEILAHLNNGGSAVAVFSRTSYTGSGYEKVLTDVFPAVEWETISDNQPSHVTFAAIIPDNTSVSSIYYGGFMIWNDDSVYITTVPLALQPDESYEPGQVM